MRNFKFIHFFILLILGNLGLIKNSIAENQPTLASPAAESVIVGMYPVNIMGLDPRDGSIRMSFYVWYRTKNSDFKPDSIEIINASDAQIMNTSSGKNGDETYTTQHYQATLSHNWNFKYFPFDHQNFEVYIEASDPITTRVLIPDLPQSHPNPNIQIANWDLVGFKVRARNISYNTNFGDTSSFASTYSRIEFFYDYKHDGWRIYTNLFVAFFVCAFFCILTNFFDDPDIRLQLILAAVIGFIGNKYIVDTTIPEVSGFTLSDAIQASTFVTMILALLGVLLEKKIPLAKRKIVNLLIVSITATCYISYIAYYTYVATHIVENI